MHLSCNLRTLDSRWAHLEAWGRVVRELGGFLSPTPNDNIDGRLGWGIGGRAEAPTARTAGWDFNLLPSYPSALLARLWDRCTSWRNTHFGGQNPCFQGPGPGWLSHQSSHLPCGHGFPGLGPSRSLNTQEPRGSLLLAVPCCPPTQPGPRQHCHHHHHIIHLQCSFPVWFQLADTHFCTTSIEG